HQSDLPLDPSFPVLISNLIGWLTPGSSAAGQSIAPGAPVDVVAWPAATRIVLVRPDGSSDTLAPPFPARPIVDTDQLGVYRIVQSAPGQPDRVSQFAVNLFSAQESDLTPPVALPLIQGRSTSSAVSTTVPDDLWPWLAGGVLVVLLLEWWAYRRSS
ncbi:MAG TPA: hypothetical protein VNL16_00510, partial [Chloroflexota bacterium]|nr:hypothetical protein [Chloroflexota bacterium]